MPELRLTATLGALREGGPLTALDAVLRIQPRQRLKRKASHVASAGHRIRVLDLETVIAIKEELGGEKDRAVLPILRQTLEEMRKR